MEEFVGMMGLRGIQMVYGSQAMDRMYRWIVTILLWHLECTEIRHDIGRCFKRYNDMRLERNAAFAYIVGKGKELEFGRWLDEHPDAKYMPLPEFPRTVK